MNERSLVRAFRRYGDKGDPAALATVFDATADDLRVIARHLTGDAATAEDVVQATFLTAMQKAREYDPARPLAPWLTGILVRHAHKARAVRRPQRLDEEAAPEHGPSDPAHLVQVNETRSRVTAAIERLSATDRGILEPFLVQAEPPGAIAERLGITPGAAYVRLHRALKRLRRALPVGVTPAVGLVPGRGLGAVRDEVLRGARGTAPPAASVAAPAAASIALAGALVVVAAGLTASLLLGGSEGGRGDAEHALARTSPIADESRARPFAPQGGPARRQPVTTPANTPAGTDDTPLPERVTYTGIVAHSEGLPLIAGAEVRVADGPDPELRGRLVALTGADGRFHFEAPPTALHAITIAKPGFASFRVPRAPLLRERCWNSIGIRRTPSGDVRIGMINLEPAATIHGYVVDAEDRPVAGARLTLFQRGMVPFDDRVHATSESDGSFELLHGIPKRGEVTPWIICATSARGMGWIEIEVRSEFDRIDDVRIPLRRSAPLELQLVTEEEGLVLDGLRVRAVPAQGPWAAFVGLFDASEPTALDTHLTAVADPGGGVSFAQLPLFDGAESPYAGAMTIADEPVSLYRAVLLDPGIEVVEPGLELARPGSKAAAALTEMFGSERRTLTIRRRPD
ncbi:MAG: sigma-70 family RNA polymerase sigma factor [bacterium]|nr:sigma-70 family RNA polymerase sigma factor [bacterium]